MTKEIKKNENAEALVSFKFDGAEWKEAQDKAFKKLAANVQIKGFRKGNAPESLVRQHVNPAEVLQNAIDIAVQPAFEAALQEGKLEPFMQPELKVNKVTQDELECVVIVPLKPVVKLGAYKNLGIEKKATKVSAKEVDEEINKLLANNAELTVKDDAAVLGDTVVLDFEGFVDGKAFDGGKADNYTLELGSNSFIPGFEDQLVGLKAGEAKDVNVKFPEAYVPELAGKDATFKCLVHEVKAKVVPALDDDFVAELSYEGVATVAQLKAKVKGDLANKKESEAANAQVDALVDAIVANAKIQIPSKVLDNEVEAMKENFAKQIEQNGLTTEQYYQITGQKEEDNVAQMRVQAAKNVAGFLTIQEVGAKEGLEVTDEDLNNYFENVAKQYNMDVAKVKEILGKNISGVANQIFNDKVIKFLLANNEKVEAAEAPAAEGEEKPAAKKPAAKKTTAKKAAEPKAE